MLVAKDRARGGYPRAFLLRTLPLSKQHKWRQSYKNLSFVEPNTAQ
jgi:hypothetical protein